MKQDFLDYIRETFHFSSEEMRDFEHALSRPLKKTIRVNTNKISIKDFMSHTTSPHPNPLLGRRGNELQASQIFAAPFSSKGERIQDGGLESERERIQDGVNEGEKVEGAWTLSPTPLGKNMFYIDREDTSTALGHTLEHISGYIYVQELAASSSPYYLSGDQRDESEYTILDMSASPGGKTTQLAEYYPNATIIANEIDKARMRQLHENTDRLGAKNVFVTNYDGRFFANYPEIFDKILLDAPCSGEGTAYKTDDALKYWNIKNIRRIAKLQAQLLESALIALRVGGELVYSTCTLNKLENEEVVEKILEKFGECVEIIALSSDTPHPNPLLGRRGNELQVSQISVAPFSSKGERIQDGGESGGEELGGRMFGENKNPFIRAWPHETGTGGFFVVKIKKLSSLAQDEKKLKKLQKHTQGFEKISNTDEKEIHRFLEENFSLTLPGKFYTYRNEIYYTEKNIDFIWKNFFLYKCGIKIGKFENGEFTPNYHLGTHFGKFEKNAFAVTSEEEAKLLRGEIIEHSKADGYYQIYLGNILAGIVRAKKSTLLSLLETRFLRK